MLGLWSTFAAPTLAGAGPPPDLRADLDGLPIPLVEVGRHFCDDFSYPTIHCFTRADDLETRSAAALTAGVTYVTIYEYATFAGAYMHVSEDYTVLAWIGWNDRISSFKGRNSELGAFYTDWFYSGTADQFCCNELAYSLGGFDNTFSSVHRN
jgi:hypothetical protein